MSAGNEREFIDFQQDKEKGGLAMKCPLFVIRIIQEKGPVDLQKLNCLKEKCAWWAPFDGSCAILTLAREIALIKEELEAIKDKMPHVEQFKK